jgi:hypothetical protein
MYIVIYKTESGDEGIEGYWEENPTDKHLETYFRENNPDEFDDERKRRYIFWDVYELEKKDLPKPSKKVTPTI